MDQSLLSSRAIVGSYYAALEANAGRTWLPAVCNNFTSNQKSEQYGWLGQVPAMREWIGGRQKKGLRTNDITIINKPYETTLGFSEDDRRRDKTGQIEVRMGELVERGNTHWASLVSTLILGGESGVCYDGQYFFDTDHAEGSSGTQSNKIQVDISTLPAAVHGTQSAPSVEEFQQAMVAGITQILGFKDDQGEPMNEGAREFLVQVPMSLYITAAAAVSSLNTAALQQNLNVNLLGMRIRIETNARLTWTTKFAIFRTDSATKAIICQGEFEPTLMVLDEGSDYYFAHKEIQIGIDASRGAGYGLWQRACLVEMT